jgi:hypothetical protein
MVNKGVLDKIVAYGQRSGLQGIAQLQLVARKNLVRISTQALQADIRNVIRLRSTWGSPKFKTKVISLITWGVDDFVTAEALSFKPDSIDFNKAAAKDSTRIT